MRKSVHCPKCNQALNVEVAADGTCVVPRHGGKAGCPGGEQVYKYVDHGTPAQQRSRAIAAAEEALRKRMAEGGEVKLSPEAADALLNMEKKAMDAAFARE